MRTVLCQYANKGVGIRIPNRHYTWSPARPLRRGVGMRQVHCGTIVGPPAGALLPSGLPSPLPSPEGGLGARPKQAAPAAHARGAPDAPL
eukprot:2221559-Prymnesium_polylepis.1